MESESNLKPAPGNKKANAVAAATSAADGFNAPIEHSGEGRVPDHINPDTMMAKGVDPDKGLVTVNLQALKKQHGEKKGRELYNKIAIAGGFYDPNSEPVGSDFAPDLALEGMNKDARAKVDAILEGK